MCATLEKIFNLVYYYRNYRSKMFAGIDFTSGDTGILSKKAFKFNKKLLYVLILAVALLLAGCGGAKSTRAKADETVHTCLLYTSGIAARPARMAAGSRSRARSSMVQTRT